MSQFEILNQAVTNATTIYELIPFLQNIVNDLNSIKLLIKDKLNHLNEDQARTAFYASLSMEDLLSKDVIQMISSFDTNGNMKGISKAFQNCANQNVKCEIKQNSESILSKFRQGTTWVVRDSELRLSDEDKLRGFKGPLFDINTAIDTCADGDTVLIEDGQYWLKPVHINKSLKIIGRGQNVSVCGCDEYDQGGTAQVVIFNDTHIQSIEFGKIQFLIGHWSEKEILKPPNVVFENCTFAKEQYGNILEVYRGSLIVCNSCFHRRNIFHMSQNADALYVYGCVFDECPRSYNNIFPFVQVVGVKKKFKCVDCVFPDAYR